MEKDASQWWLTIHQDIQSTATPGELFRRVQAAADALGFKHCCYGVSQASGFSSTEPERSMIIFDSYPGDWMSHYTSQNYIACDPTVRIGTRSTGPIVWSDELFAPARQLWKEARDGGLRVGIAQSCWGPGGTYGLLSLARDAEPLSATELAQVGPRMRWLVENTHARMQELLEASKSREPEVPLSSREAEVLSWTADGKTSWEIAQILGISESTVNYHVKRLLQKLNAQNKIQAAVKALASGQLFPAQFGRTTP